MLLDLGKSQKQEYEEFRRGVRVVEHHTLGGGGPRQKPRCSFSALDANKMVIIHKTTNISLKKLYF